MNAIFIVILILIMIYALIVNISFHLAYRDMGRLFNQFNSRLPNSKIDQDGVYWDKDGNIFYFKDTVLESEGPGQIPPLRAHSYIVPALWYYRAKVYFAMRKYNKSKEYVRQH